MPTSSLFEQDRYAFLDCEANHRLCSLRAAPFALTNQAAMTPERLRAFVAEGCGFKLLYGTQRVTSEVMEALWSLAQEAQCIEKMEAMQAGEVINYIQGQESEHRMVLHTAMRDFFDQPNPAPQAALAKEAAQVEYEKLETFVRELDSHKRYTDLVFIGIGGSELGPKTLCFSLECYARPDRRVHFLSNVDPDNAALTLRGLDLSRTLVMVVSKSGSTLETKTNEDLVRDRFQKAGLKPQEHFICATGKGSPMDDPKMFHRCFYIWDYVGGRFCSTSMVGGVLLAFAYGMEVYRDLLRGAHEMDRCARERSLETNLPLLAALLGIWNRNYLGYPTVAIVPYSQALIRFAAHIQQCDMESNGKHIDRHGEQVSFPTGPIIWGEPATNAQHSFFQLIHQGTDVIPLEFIGFRDAQFGEDLELQGTTSQEKLLSNLFAQSLALAMGQQSSNPNKEFKGNRPSSILLGKRLDAFTVGALLAYYEHKVAFQGFVWNINSFDQEGVQLGKVLANQFIEAFASQKQKAKGAVNLLEATFLDQLKTL